MNLKLTTILTYADIGTISSCLAVDDAMGNLGLLQRWGVVFKVSRIKPMKYILYSRFSH